MSSSMSGPTCHPQSLSLSSTRRRLEQGRRRPELGRRLTAAGAGREAEQSSSSAGSKAEQQHARPGSPEAGGGQAVAAGPHPQQHALLPQPPRLERRRRCQEHAGSARRCQGSAEQRRRRWRRWVIAEAAPVWAGLAVRGGGARSVVVAPSKTKTAGGGEAAVARGWCSHGRCGRAQWQRPSVATTWCGGGEGREVASGGGEWPDGKAFFC
uniref:Uncharacterized protein n=1 Tax=Oryza sativa subsp. japonica TaxID=39947 RepID=Q852B3_ORYSJ|nr:hypothetical protein [Oryza sativa Japonica Group]